MAFGFRLNEAVRTYENFFSEDARIYSVISALGYTIPLLGPLWEHLGRGSATLIFQRKDSTPLALFNDDNSTSTANRSNEYIIVSWLMGPVWLNWSL